MEYMPKLGREDPLVDHHWCFSQFCCVLNGKKSPCLMVHHIPTGWILQYFGNPEYVRRKRLAPLGCVWKSFTPQPIGHTLKFHETFLAGNHLAAPFPKTFHVGTKSSKSLDHDSAFQLGNAPFQNTAISSYLYVPSPPWTNHITFQYVSWFSWWKMRFLGGFLKMGV